jgi:hypothetical protein
VEWRGKEQGSQGTPLAGVVQHTLARSSTEQENAGLWLVGRGARDLAPGLRGPPGMGAGVCAWG